MASSVQLFPQQGHPPRLVTLPPPRRHPARPRPTFLYLLVIRTAATLASPSRPKCSAVPSPLWSAVVPPFLTVPLLPPCRAALPFSPPSPPAFRYTAVPPYRLPAVRCRRGRLTTDPYRAAPPSHTHLTSCSTEFALRSEPSRRCVPQRPRWARRTGPRVLRSNLAEPERRLARWMLA